MLAGFPVESSTQCLNPLHPHSFFGGDGDGVSVGKWGDKMEWIRSGDVCYWCLLGTVFLRSWNDVAEYGRIGGCECRMSRWKVLTWLNNFNWRSTWTLFSFHYRKACRGDQRTVPSDECWTDLSGMEWLDDCHVKPREEQREKWREYSWMRRENARGVYCLKYWGLGS